MNVLLIDMTNLAMKNAFASVKADPFDGGVWTKWATRTAGDIINFIGDFNADRCILAMDSTSYWRQKIYPEYKAHRRQFKKDSIIDFDNFNAFYFKFMEKFIGVFSNIICFTVKLCEADDIVAVLTKKHSESGDTCTIISEDKDFNQLTKYVGVKHYNPIGKKEVMMLNPQRSLDIKVICGDTNDNIPPIRRGIGIKSAEKIINNHIDILNSSDTLLVENFQRNRILIDFDFIPKEIASDIIIEYEKKLATTIPVASKKVFDFIMNHGLLSKWQTQQSMLIKLNT